MADIVMFHHPVGIWKDAPQKATHIIIQKHVEDDISYPAEFPFIRIEKACFVQPLHDQSFFQLPRVQPVKYVFRDWCLEK